MINLKILAQPRTRWYSNVHPYYRWKKQLRDNGIKVDLLFDHNNQKLRKADVVLIHSRYFDRGWQNLTRRTDQNEQELIEYLTSLKKDVGKVIWYDESDSTGVADFPIIPYVDVLAKKQVLKDKTYYLEQDGNRDLRIWLNKEQPTKTTVLFKPCPADQIHKLKPAWNIAVTDYRYYPLKFSRLSNYLPYSIYSPWITKVDTPRNLDLIFRGKINYDEENIISYQRNKVLELLQTLDLKVSAGGRISKKQYLKELSQSKVSVSPFGFGELCWRDFETFNSGSLLIKPSMDHLITYPDVFVTNETYIPVKWDLSDLQEKLEDSLANYETYKPIAKNGQERFTRIINDPNFFVKRVKAIIE